jgi:hypothetical protein
VRDRSIPRYSPRGRHVKRSSRGREYWSACAHRSRPEGEAGFRTRGCECRRRCYSCTHAPVAQLDRASVFGTEGCRFESYRAYFHQNTTANARTAVNLGIERTTTSERSIPCSRTEATPSDAERHPVPNPATAHSLPADLGSIVNAWADLPPGDPASDAGNHAISAGG